MLTLKLLPITEAFKLFYNQKFNGVVLTWQYETSVCEVIGHFDDKVTFFDEFNAQYNLSVSYVQACILKLFNKHQKLSFKQIQNIIGFEDEDVRLNLMSFLLAKDKIMEKTPDVTLLGFSYYLE